MFKTDKDQVLSLQQMLDEMKEALAIEIRVREDEGASKAFGLEVPKSGKASSSIPAAVFQPDASQQRAIQMALGNEVTYIIGPLELVKP